MCSYVNLSVMSSKPYSAVVLNPIPTRWADFEFTDEEEKALQRFEEVKSTSQVALEKKLTETLGKHRENYNEFIKYVSDGTTDLSREEIKIMFMIFRTYLAGTSTVKPSFVHTVNGEPIEGISKIPTIGLCKTESTLPICCEKDCANLCGFMKDKEGIRIILPQCISHLKAKFNFEIKCPKPVKVEPKVEPKIEHKLDMTKYKFLEEPGKTVYKCTEEQANYCPHVWKIPDGVDRRELTKWCIENIHCDCGKNLFVTTNTTTTNYRGETYTLMPKDGYILISQMCQDCIKPIRAESKCHAKGCTKNQHWFGLTIGTSYCGDHLTSTLSPKFADL